MAQGSLFTGSCLCEFQCEPELSSEMFGNLNLLYSLALSSLFRNGRKLVFQTFRIHTVFLSFARTVSKISVSWAICRCVKSDAVSYSVLSAVLI